jgi:hypothetical protein
MYVGTNLKGWLEEKLPPLLSLGQRELDAEVKMYTSKLHLSEFRVFIGCHQSLEVTSFASTAVKSVCI